MSGKPKNQDDSMDHQVGSELDLVKSTELSVSNTHFANMKTDKRIVSTVFDVCFTPAKHGVDKDLFTAEELALIADGQAPWARTRISKGYWGGVRDYDELDIGMYGAVGTDDDRHLLDYIIAAGKGFKPSFIREATLRQIIWAIELRNSLAKEKDSEYNTVSPEYRSTHLPKSIPLDYLSNTAAQKLDTHAFSDNYVYLFCEVSKILTLLGKSTNPTNRNNLLKALNKLTMVEFRVTPMREGELQTSVNELKFKLMDNFYYTMCDTSNVRNKKALNKDSFNYVLVGIGRDYYASLEQDGSIPRGKILDKYVGIKNTAHVVDFIKYLEQNKLTYFNNKNLRETIKGYYDRKVLLVSEKNREKIISNRVNATMKVLLGVDEQLCLEKITGYEIVFKNDKGNQVISPKDGKIDVKKATLIQTKMKKDIYKNKVESL
ncbi:hypothetical protein [Vibrio crassostreae]|uniref:hypothetical protein n=1 Tax=Vibrio crassostreae TaxID=246167 RepID=UPI001B312A24|nr:hypothetical protein [Vibrio crassostreae]